MKLVFPCSECFFEGNVAVYTEIEINDDNIYEVECENGHKSVDFIKNEKFEILFDLGLLAVNAGFARESVSSFASSLERFYEYCIKIMLFSKNVNIEDVESTWKLVSASSERQLGAFYFMYLSEFNKAPVQLANNQTTFRNSVIHKGEIPTKDKVLKYADAVYNLINKVLADMKSRYQESMDDYYNERKRELELRLDAEVSSSQFGTAVDISYPLRLIESRNLFEELKCYNENDFLVLYTK